MFGLWVGCLFDCLLVLCLVQNVQGTWGIPASDTKVSRRQLTLRVISEGLVRP